MIQSLEIKNFKSIRNLDIPCRKVNVFIGEPNSGKSNIIEALALQSENIMFAYLNPVVFRYKHVGDLFHDANINEPIEVKTNEHVSQLKYAMNEHGVPMNQFHFYFDLANDSTHPLTMEFDGKIINYGQTHSTNVHYYEFVRAKEFVKSYLPYLSVPHGENLPGLLLANDALKKWVSELFRSFKYRLMLRPVENDIRMAKEVNEELYDYGYYAISETIQRLIFYSLAIKSNQKAVLLFDEPESNMFPFYIKDFAERIAEDETNQFFITTHNPYLLGSLLDKCPKEAINVFITKMDAYETKVSQCNQEQIEELISLGSGSFFSLDNLLNESVK